MEPSRILPIVLAIAAFALVCAPVEAQTEPGASAPQPAKVRKSADRPLLFSNGNESGTGTPSPVFPIEFRPYDRMSQPDRDLAADAESAIGERAGFAGLEFNEGQWAYRQVVCSALTNHLFLLFTRNNGTSEMSLFSASIPRNSEGRVRIIPIMRRGYSLFSPAPINALTVSAFNHIRAEEHSGQAPDWLGTGMCYATLAGAHPQIGPVEDPDLRKNPAAPPGRMVVPLNGGAVIRFTDVAAPSRPMQWTITFSTKGRLLKATHSAAPREKEKAVRRTPAEVQGKPVNATAPDAKAILIK